MPFVITDPCIDTKDQACVSVCPVDCIHFEEGDRMLYINPAECIDCGACQPACPVSAIYPDSGVPEAAKKFIQINELWYSDKAAARAMVGGGAAPAAAPADGGHAPAAAAAPAAAKAAPKVDDTPPVMQVPATKDAHAPRVAVHDLPPALGFISLALFCVTYALIFILPGMDVMKGMEESGIPAGAAILPLMPVAIVLLLVFLFSQTRELGVFAARQPRSLTAWRGVKVEWRRNEESRRYNLAETVQAIARERFAFPSDENPDLRTYVNLPEPKMAIEPRGTGEKVFPDIVSVVYPGNYPVAVAQVESRETVTLDQARYVWTRLQHRGVDLYLYVPAGLLSRAQDYAKVVGLKDVKFRTWRWTPVGMVVREA